MKGSIKVTVVETPVVTEVFKIGNLTKDPELRYGQNGQAIVEVDLAVNPPKDTGGETQFYKLVMFRNLAENASESLEKSMRVVVVGRPDIERWEDKENPGSYKEKKKIIVSAIGPDLRYATAEVTKVHRTYAPQANNVDTSSF